MKSLIVATALAASTLFNTASAGDVGVSVSVGQPGFYGRIDVGDFPRPVVIYREPRVVQVVPVSQPPIYLRVPPGHARHWHHHCGKYNACGERVYFVRDEWYQREYVPYYRERHHDHDRGHREERREWREEHRGGRH